MQDAIDFFLVSADLNVAGVLNSVSQSEGWSHEVVSTFDAALERLEAQRYRIILVDVDDEGLRGRQILEWMVLRRHFSLCVLMTSAPHRTYWDSGAGMAATSVIHRDFFAGSPALRNRLLDLLDRYRSCREGREYSSRGGVAWIGADVRMRAALEKARLEARHLGPVMVTGRRGSGLRQWVRLVASENPRARVLWVEGASPDCREIWKQILQSLNDGVESILCLSEVDRLPEPVQESVMGLLRDEPLSGENGKSWPRVKIIATRPDHSGDDGVVLWRSDLRRVFEVSQVAIPPLKDRVDDVPFLADFFLNELPDKGEALRCFSDDAMEALKSYDWPGEVAELRDVVSVIVAKNDAKTIRAKDLPSAILEKSFYVRRNVDRDWVDLPYDEAKKMALNKFNREYIFELLNRSQHNLTVAAEKAGMDRSNFKKIIKKYLPEE